MNIIYIYIYNIYIIYIYHIYIYIYHIYIYIYHIYIISIYLYANIYIYIYIINTMQYLFVYIPSCSTVLQTITSSKFIDPAPKKGFEDSFFHKDLMIFRVTFTRPLWIHSLGISLGTARVAVPWVWARAAVSSMGQVFFDLFPKEKTTTGVAGWFTFRNSQWLIWLINHTKSRICGPRAPVGFFLQRLK